MTATNSSQEIYTTERVVITTSFVLIAIVGTLINVPIIYVVLWNEIVRNVKSNYFLLMHTMADTIMCLITLPIMTYIINSNVKEETDEKKSVCKILIAVSFACSYITLFGLAAMSADRHLAIAQPYLYHRKVTGKSYIKVVLFLFLL